MKQPVIAHFDGLCEAAYPGGPRNPGGAACGGWFVLPHAAYRGLEHGLRGGRVYCAGPSATSNTAEYRAALDALAAICRTGWRGPVVLRGDSQLVTRQYSGAYGCYKPALQDLLARLRDVAGHFESVQLEWIPREQNATADALSRAAYRAWRARRSAA